MRPLPLLLIHVDAISIEILYGGLRMFEWDALLTVIPALVGAAGVIVSQTVRKILRSIFTHPRQRDLVITFRDGDEEHVLAIEGKSPGSADVGKQLQEFLRTVEVAQETEAERKGEGDK